MPTVDPLHVCIGLGPLAMYLLALGAVNLSARPLLTTGGRDFVALGIGVSGLVAVGPMELFLAEGAAEYWGPWIWGLTSVNRQRLENSANCRWISIAAFLVFAGRYGFWPSLISAIRRCTDR